MSGSVKRLSKVAKELNVGISTIVDYLSGQGHQIDSNPNSKISEDIYHILLQNEKSDRILERIRKIVAQSIAEFMQTKVENDPIPILFEVPIDLLAAYFSGALLSCVDWWLEQGTSYSPEEMTRMFQRLFFPGARKILGMPGPETEH